MKVAVAILAAALIATGCATADFQAYEGVDTTREGKGGTKVTVKGIDFWTTGEPPRKFKVVGMLKSEISDGWGADSQMRSELVPTIQKVGGDAAIQLSENSQYAGTYNMPGYSTTNVTMIGNQAYANTVTTPGYGIAVNVKTVTFAVVKYVD